MNNKVKIELSVDNWLQLQTTHNQMIHMVSLAVELIEDIGIEHPLAEELMQVDQELCAAYGEHTFSEIELVPLFDNAIK